MKRLLFSMLIFLCCISQSAAWMNVTVVGGGVPTAGSVCSSSESAAACSDSDDNFNMSSGPAMQKISNAAAITICTITVYSKATTAAGAAIHAEIWSTVDTSGTQYGSDSEAGTYSVDNTWQTVTLAWLSNHPNPSGDFFIHFYRDAGEPYIAKLGGGTCYSTTDYDAWRTGADDNSDMRFELFVE